MLAHCIAQHLLDRREGVSEQSLPSTTAFLAPSHLVLGHYEGEEWFPAQPSTASRNTARRSRASCVGSLVDLKSNRTIKFESKLEADLADILLADTVAHLQEQPPRVRFIDRMGQPHHHTFDFIATKVDGRRIAYAVKPEIRVESSGIKTKLRLIKEQNPGFADKYVLATEQAITKRRVAYAQWIHWARRGRNQEDINMLMPLVMSLNGAVRMDVLTNSSGLGGRGFCALVCLLDDGVLKLDGPSIGQRASVRLNPNFSI